MNSERELLRLPGAVISRPRPPSGPIALPLAPKDIALRGVSPDDGSWRALPPRKRAVVATRAAALLRERAETLARSLTSEFGTILHESRSQVEVAAEIIDREIRRPAPLATTTSGRLLLFCVQPRNCGFEQLARLSASHLLAGTTVMVKHSGRVPKSAAAFEDLWHEAGAPRGVFANLVISYD